MLDLIRKLARADAALQDTTILAPRPLGGKIRVRLEGLVREFACRPSDFEGWGLFRTVDERTVEAQEVANLPLVSTYLGRLPATRLILTSPGEGRTWQAVPANRDEFANRFGPSAGLTLRLVERGRSFETVVARWDGSNFWYDRPDRSTDPTVPAQLARELRQFTPAAALRIPGLTPEMRQAYASLHTPDPGATLIRCSEERLKQALAQGGGQLESFSDCGDYWNTRWVTRDGYSHVSAIAKTDLTVLSAGICLSGEDQKFDLASLVGVVEAQQEW